MKLRCLGDENQILEAGLRLKAMNEWGGGRSQSGDVLSYSSSINASSFTCKCTLYDGKDSSIIGAHSEMIKDY